MVGDHRRYDHSDVPDAEIRRTREPSQKTMDVAEGLTVVAHPDGVAVAVETKGRLVGVVLTPADARTFADSIVEAANTVTMGARPPGAAAS